MATRFSERSELADIDDDGLLEIISKLGIDIQGDSLAQDPVQFGRGSSAVANSTAVGVNALAAQRDAAAFGLDAQASGDDTTALGTETRAPANWNTVVGYQAGSNKNGENVVIVGRKAEAQGNDAIAIGESARANAAKATAIGKASAALASSASVFGQGATVSGQGATVLGQGITVSASDATGIGTNISVTAPGATAIGSGATASGEDSLALGKDTVVALANAVGFGDRDIEVQPGRSVIYPETSTAQTLADLSIVEGSSAGTRHEYTLDINGEPILVIRGESDGAGGLQNAVARVEGSFALEGDANEVTDTVTGTISVQDGAGVEQVGIDATVSPVDIDLHNNPVQNFRLRNGTGIAYQDDPAQQSLVDFNVTTAPTEGTEQSYTLDAGGTTLLKVFAEANGAGGVQNTALRAPTGIDTDTVSDNGAGQIDFEVSDSTQAELQSDGDLRIEGALTEGSAL